MQYSELSLKTNTKTVPVVIGDKEINVLQYLPIQDKIDLIQVALENSKERNGIFNDMKLEVYFNMYIVYLYTDLEFTDEEKANVSLLYDQLQSNDVLTAIISAMGEEYDNLFTYLTVMRKVYDQYNMSTAALIKAFIEDLPEKAAAAAEIVQNFDPQKYQNVVNFAKALNGGRDIPQGD